VPYFPHLYDLLVLLVLLVVQLPEHFFSPQSVILVPLLVPVLFLDLALVLVRWQNVSAKAFVFEELSMRCCKCGMMHAVSALPNRNWSWPVQAQARCPVTLVLNILPRSCLLMQWAR